MIKLTGMTKKEKYEATAKILEKHGFYNEADYVRTKKNKAVYIELVKKTYGNTSEKLVEDVFGKDYKDLAKLCKSLKIQLDPYVWYD